jgi:hypothetical protein
MNSWTIPGLGKQEQGINQCLQVEKTSKRGGKIINQEKGNVNVLSFQQIMFNPCVRLNRE